MGSEKPGTVSALKRQTAKAAISGLVVLGSVWGACAQDTGPASVSTAPPPTRQRELLYLLKQDCGSCHGLTLKGGLGPPLLPSALAVQADDVLVNTILLGRPGTPMPPWEFALARGEVEWLVQMLRKGVDNDL